MELRSENYKASNELVQFWIDWFIKNYDSKINSMLIEQELDIVKRAIEDIQKRLTNKNLDNNTIDFLSNQLDDWQEYTNLLNKMLSQINSV